MTGPSAEAVGGMTGRLTYSIAEAAERLGGPFTVDFLKARIKKGEVPFIKTGAGTGRGGRVGFSEQQLAAIVALYTVQPAEPQPGVQRITRRSARGGQVA